MKSRLVPWADRVARLVPARSRLALRMRFRRLLGALDPELGDLEGLAGRGRLAADVGANEGWYALPLSGLFERVIAFEPNDLLLGDLRSAAKVNIEIHACAISSRRGVGELHVPVRRGLALTGWASLHPGHLPSRDRLISRNVRLETLDALALPSLDFLKVDVEGHEVEVCRGALETIDRFRPRVLIEVQEENSAEVDALLGSCGLVRARPQDGRAPLSPGNSYYRSVESSATGERGRS